MVKTKNEYQQLIHIYVARSKAMRKKHGYGTPEHRASIVGINKKLKTWRSQIWALNKREAKLKELYKNVTEFIGFPPTSSLEAKYIYIKWGMEHGLRGTYLGRYIQVKNLKGVSEMRKRFTLSFAKYPERRELYQRFKLFIKDKQEVI